MKRCPKCSRTFPDENQKFCTFDGGLLRPDQPTFDPNMTVRAPSHDLLDDTPTLPTPDSSEAKTSVRLGPLNETIASFGTSTFQEQDARTSRDLTPPVPLDESAPTSTDLSAYPVPRDPEETRVSLPPPPPFPTPPTVAPEPVLQQAAPQQPVPPQAEAQPAQPVAPAAAGEPKKKRSVLPWVLAGLLVLLLLGSGAAVVGYFFVVKPMLAKRGTVLEPTNTNTNTNTEPKPSENASPVDTASPAETKKEPEPFTPPSGAVQFASSVADLDGELADHFVGFSFYYPRDWVKDPKSGVKGASSYAKLDKSSDETGNSLQERVLFNWYPSKGTYDADTDVFQQSAKKVTDQLAKGLPNFEEVSRGETTVNTYKGYEVRFKGVFKDTDKGDVPYWGRVVFLPPGSDSEKGGVAIVMLATSLAQDVTSAADVGDKGGMALMLDSFRFASR